MVVQHGGIDSSSLSEELWYLSFERVAENGNGLATYYRHVIDAAKATGRRIRIYQTGHGKKAVSRSTDGPVTHIYVPDSLEPLKTPLGYWMNLSWAMADVVCRDLSISRPPLSIEVPDGFAIGYFLMQKKLIGDPALKDIPIILVAHTPIGVIDQWNERDVYSLPNWWTFRAEKWCFKAADAVITLSSMLENVLRQQGYLEKDQMVVRLLNPYIKDVKARSRNPYNTVLTVGMASRMVTWKGMSEALALAREAARTGVDMRLELCGETSPEFEKARQTHSELFESGMVQYLGCLSHTDLLIRREKWDCQIHPSHFDNFPYSVLEALSTGLPCFIGGTNGVAEVLPTKLQELLVCDFRNPAEVLPRLIRLSTIQHEINELELAFISQLNAQEYFASRDRVSEEIAKRRNSRSCFPFVDSDQCKSGLRPLNPIPASATGARLTVVVPYFNMGAYIGDTIKSILGSSVLTNIVLVNDGSTERASIDALDQYRNDERILVLDIPNGGVARARNYGVSQASTEYVALLDADDTVEYNYYKKAIDVLDTYDNVGFVGCWANDFQDGTNKSLRYWPTYNAEPMPNIVMNNTNCQALIYRRELYMECGQHDPRLKMYLDDWDGMLGMLEGGYFGVMVPEPLFNYRQRANSIFSSGRGLWAPNYAYIVKKRAALIQRNSTEAILFSNANGPNYQFHLLGWHTPVHEPRREATSFKQSLVKFWESLPKPIQRIIEPIADKIDKYIQ